MHKRDGLPKVDEQVTLPLEHLERFIMFGGWDVDSHFWCLHCERACPIGRVRLVRNGRELLQMCPYEGCGGDAVMDAWLWRERRQLDSTLPEVPAWGVVYPLYG